MDVGDPREMVRDANPLADVVQEYIPLQGDGKNLKALCPFHPEKTPSFKVDPGSHHYRCFGCGERGDVFSFVMKMEKLEFREALEKLAQRGGVTLPRWRGNAARTPRKELGEVLQVASAFYRAQLQTGAGSVVRTYLDRRSITGDTQARFEIGFAPPGWSGLADELRRRRAPLKEAESLGLLKEGNSGGHYDTFRGRLMFPIRNLQGKTVGFGGRILPEFERKEDDYRDAKYINSPESAVFKKGQVLYGLYEGRDEIRRDRSLLLMEGYTDVVLAHQAGYTTAVATLGTALTEENAVQIARHADRITLVFDGDDAGRKAAYKAVGLFIDRPVEVRVVLLSEGHDPGDMLVSESGREAFRAALDGAQDAVDHVLQALKNTHGSQGGVALERIVREFSTLLGRMPTETRKQAALEQASRALGISVARLRADHEKIRAGTRARPQAESERPRPKTGLPGDEGALMRMLVTWPDKAETLLSLFPPEEIRDPLSRRIALKIRELAGEVSALHFEEPDEKSKYLDLADGLDEAVKEEESVVRFLREMLLFRLQEKARSRRGELTKLRTSGEASHRADSERVLKELLSVQKEIAALEVETDDTWDGLESRALGLVGDAASSRVVQHLD